MPTNSGASRQPVAIARYLLPREQPILHFRQHPAVVIQALATAVAGLAAAVIVSIEAPHQEAAKAAVWIVLAFLECRAIYLVLLWLVQYWAITNTRLLVCSGFFTRTVTSYDLSDFRYCALERNMDGKLLGYGSLVFNAGRLNRTRIDFVPYPDSTYLSIYGMLSPELADGDSLADGLSELAMAPAPD